jgi:hypothetical protein
VNRLNMNLRFNCPAGKHRLEVRGGRKGLFSSAPRSATREITVQPGSKLEYETWFGNDLCLEAKV